MHIQNTIYSHRYVDIQMQNTGISRKLHAVFEPEMQPMAWNPGRLHETNGRRGTFNYSPNGSPGFENGTRGTLACHFLQAIPAVGSDCGGDDSSEYDKMLFDHGRFS